MELLEELIDPLYEPTAAEIGDYAAWLSYDTAVPGALALAAEGLKAPLPLHWRPCRMLDTQEVFYYNVATGVSSWEHPNDAVRAPARVRARVCNCGCGVGRLVGCGG